MMGLFFVASLFRMKVSHVLKAVPFLQKFRWRILTPFRLLRCGPEPESCSWCPAAGSRWRSRRWTGSATGCSSSSQGSARVWSSIHLIQFHKNVIWYFKVEKYSLNIHCSKAPGSELVSTKRINLIDFIKNDWVPVVIKNLFFSDTTY